MCDGHTGISKSAWQSQTHRLLRYTCFPSWFPRWEWPCHHQAETQGFPSSSFLHCTYCPILLPLKQGLIRGELNQAQRWWAIDWICPGEVTQLGKDQNQEIKCKWLSTTLSIGIFWVPGPQMKPVKTKPWCCGLLKEKHTSCSSTLNIVQHYLASDIWCVGFPHIEQFFDISRMSYSFNSILTLKIVDAKLFLLGFYGVLITQAWLMKLLAIGDWTQSPIPLPSPERAGR